MNSQYPILTSSLGACPFSHALNWFFFLTPFLFKVPMSIFQSWHYPPHLFLFQSFILTTPKYLTQDWQSFRVSINLWLTSPSPFLSLQYPGFGGVCLRHGAAGRGVRWEVQGAEITWVYLDACSRWSHPEAKVQMVVISVCTCAEVVIRELCKENAIRTKHVFSNCSQKSVFVTIQASAQLWSDHTLFFSPEKTYSSIICLSGTYIFQQGYKVVEKSCLDLFQLSVTCQTLQTRASFD